jgi:hypothetical protein
VCSGQGILARFYDGTEVGEFVLAVKVNSAHGLPLPLAHRTAAAARIAASHPQWSVGQSRRWRPVAQDRGSNPALPSRWEIHHLDAWVRSATYATGSFTATIPTLAGGKMSHEGCWPVPTIGAGNQSFDAAYETPPARSGVPSHFRTSRVRGCPPRYVPAASAPNIAAYPAGRAGLPAKARCDRSSSLPCPVPSS